MEAQILRLAGVEWAGMAKKKEATEGPAEGALVQAAKTIGEAAGKIATAVGVAKPAKPKAQKLAKKNKSRLPRRQKKAARKTIKST
jgi:hypothetical protein